MKIQLFCSKCVFYLLLLFSLPIFAQLPRQPYEPLFFKQQNYAWYQTSKDPQKIPPKSDGYNCFKPTYNVGPSPIIHEGFLYKISFSFDPNIVFSGAYIEKRDVKDGSLIWQQYFGYDGMTERIEYPQLMYINQDNDLEIICQQNQQPYDSIPFQLYFDNLFLTKRIYDLKSGNLKSFVKPEGDEMDYVPSGFYTLRDVIKFYREDRGTRIFYKSKIEGVPGWAFYYITMVINPLDKYADYDTLRSEFSDSDFPYFKIKEDQFLITEFIDSTSQYVFKYVDGKMKVLKQVISETVDWPILSGLEILDYDEASDLFLARLIDVDLDNYQISIDMVVFNGQGKFTKRVHLPDDYNGFCRVLGWKDGKIKVVIEERLRGLGIEVWVENGNNFEIFAKNDINNENKSIAICDVIETKDQFILNVWERAIYYNSSHLRYELDQFGDATSLIAFPKDIFGVSRAEDTNLSSFTIISNPSTVIADVRFSDKISGMLIVRNVQGKQIESRMLENKDEAIFQCQHWPEGIYFLTFYNNDKQSITKKFVKI